jgi:hypothetical protein
MTTAMTTAETTAETSTGSPAAKTAAAELDAGTTGTPTGTAETLTGTAARTDTPTARRDGSTDARPETTARRDARTAAAGTGTAETIPGPPPGQRPLTPPGTLNAGTSTAPTAGDKGAGNVGMPDARTDTPTPGGASADPGAGTLARRTAAAPGTAETSPPEIALRAHKPDAGTVAPLTAGTAAPAPGTDAGLLLDLQQLWVRPPDAAETSPALDAAGVAPGGLARTDDGTPAAETAAEPNARTAARKPTAAEILAARAPARCLTHTDPRDWLDEPADRPGFIYTTCRRCGGFVGYRPDEPQTRRRSSKGG